LQVTDEDLDDEHAYSIIDNSLEVTDSSLEYLKERTPFVIKGDALVLNFDVQDSSLKGLFKFAVEVSDKGSLRTKCFITKSLALHSIPRGQKFPAL
jgi:hypothetical protein